MNIDMMNGVAGNLGVESIDSGGGNVDSASSDGGSSGSFD